MGYVRGFAAVLVGLNWVSGASAQVLIGPPPGVGFSIGRQLVFLHPGRPLSVHGRFGPFGPAYFAPYPYHPYAGPHYRQVTVFYSPPPVVLPPPLVLARDRDDDDLDRLDQLLRRERRDVMREPPVRPERPEPLFPGERASVFRPIRPEDRDRALKPVPLEPEMPAEPLKPPPPVPWPPQGREPALPAPPGPLPDVRAEGDRQLTIGRAMFRAGEYGRAAARFRQAGILNPDDVLAPFLLAQAHFATGKYREAVAAIHAGLRLRPDWPAERFRPRQLYNNQAAEFPEHIKRLEETLTKRPDDPVLLFLLAYQLWFDERQDEARILFQRALGLVADRRFIERFLQARPGGLVVMK